MIKISKILTSIVISIFLIFSYSNFAMAGSHPEWQEIKKIRKEIIALGEEPTKRKGFFQGDKKLLKILKKQLKELKEEIKKEEEKKRKIEAAKKELIKEIEALGEKPKIDTSDIDSDEEIIALKKQIQDIKDKKKKEKDKAKKEAEEKRKAEEKKKAEKEAKEKKEQERAKSIEAIKKELIFLGAAPISEYEFSNNDEYIAALRKQIEDIKIKNAEDEQKLKDSIPEWYRLSNMPNNTDTIIYAKGTHTSADPDQAELIGLEKARAKLAAKLSSTMNLKIDIATKEKVIEADSSFKQEINSISKSVAKEVSVGGYKVYKEDLVQISDGRYRHFVIIEFPITVAYKAFLEDIKNNPATKNNIKKLKDTKAFRELEELVDLFTAA
tara:strand:- start:3416 stop:4564 length:1149 start_codon:yes stop_codon:yes gene_type:complete